VETAGRRLTASDDRLLGVVANFLAWSPTPPRTPRELALSAARLCRLLWHGKDGGPMHDRSFARAVERACIRAGLVENPDADRDDRAPLVTPHGLRHTCASIMLSQGVSLIVVSRQLGHANPNITAMIYAHLLSDTQLDEAAAVFEAAEEDDAMRGDMREELADA
jgi:integrase